MKKKNQDVAAWIKKGREHLKKTPTGQRGKKKTLHDRGLDAWAKWNK
jgi:hypothetical protein